MRIKLPNTIKRELIERAGGKCANPGCHITRVEFHHINHWAVFKAHDVSTMIAICPTCHDAVHHSRLKISDETVLAWRNIIRSKQTTDYFLYAEAAPEPKLLVGTISYTTTQEAFLVFDFGRRMSLGMSILDGDLLQLNARFSKVNGEEYLRIVNNNVRLSKVKEIETICHPGRVKVTAPLSFDYIPSWALDQIRSFEHDYCGDGRITLLDVEILKPGLARVEGVWLTSQYGIVATRKAYYYLSIDSLPGVMQGAGEDSVILWAGKSGEAIFVFEAPPS